MKPNTCLVVDVWEGQLAIDEAVLKTNGVTGMGIRLNDMNGGHHMDTNFLKQWAEASAFVRFPYFVYNPWVNGPANFAWLAANVPTEVKGLAVDIEVRYPGYPSATYASEFKKFLDLAQARWRVIVYTGQWFLPYLTTWPNADYWWAQYPDHVTYFNQVNTWDELRVRLDKLDKPFNVNTVPGTCKMWQFSGDRLILPGNNKPIDVNLFFGTAQEMAEYFGTNPPPPPPVTHDYYRLLHDVELAKYNFKPRPMSGVDATPETVRLNGGIGNVRLSTEWENFVKVINTVKAFEFLQKPNNGWLNQGTWPHVEQLSFAGNVVEVTEIVDGRAYIKTLYNDDSPPPLASEFYDPSTMHYFGVIRKDGTIESPPSGNTRMLIIARNQKERLWVPIEELVKVDALTVYTPPGTTLPPPATEFVPSHLYQFHQNNYFQRPGGGPLTLPITRSRGYSDNRVRILWATLKPILARLNPANSAAVGQISSPNWGPSKGLDGDYIKWLGLLWPGRNVVQVEEIVGGWGRVEGYGLFKTTEPGTSTGGNATGTTSTGGTATGTTFPGDPAQPDPELDLKQLDTSTFNAYDNPNLVHKVYIYKPSSGWGENDNPVYVPILGGPWWVDMSRLVSVDGQLPKTVKIIGFPWLNVREGPGTNFKTVSRKDYNSTAVISQVKIGKDGIWGRLTGTIVGAAENWIAIRHQGINWTDWII